MGAFVMVDGIDGSGKGVIIQAFREWQEKEGLRSLDLVEYCKENKTLPEPEDITEYDAIFSSEPTYAYAGRAISDEIIKDNNRDYSAESTAWAFALDREILYRRVIIPAIKQNKYIFQERGITTSLVYQPVQGRITFKDLINMPGNKLALKYAPNLLLIAQIEPKIIMQRLQTYAVFKTLNFQRKIDQRFTSSWLKKLFNRFSSKVVYIDTNPPKTEEDTKQTALKIWKDFI